MSKLPYLEYKNNRCDLIVEGKPFLVLGGEFHNSSGSDLDYMETNVWPGIRRLGGTCYLTPVYWEAMEPQPGCYDFTLVDGVICAAEREGVKLILLWFGLWKNGKSEYIPGWMKSDEKYFYVTKSDGTLAESVSPFCDEAVELDRRAFTKLMDHLKEFDKNQTVIMIQVENETGVWGLNRDFGEKASKIFKAEVPVEISELCEVKGTWTEAFSDKAGDRFMAWAMAKAVQKIAESGKAVYPLPMFMNCVAGGPDMPAHIMPSGGPIPAVQNIWRRFAPAIDLYGPDIYVPPFKMISADFAAKNPLVIPELSQDKNSAPKALYSVAAYNTIIFSPFGIEGLMIPLTENDLLSQLNSEIIVPEVFAGELLRKTYKYILCMWEDIRKAQIVGKIHAFLEEGQEKDVFEFDECSIEVSYGVGDFQSFMNRPGHRREESPIGGGFIIEKDNNTFVICAMACNFKLVPKDGANWFINEKRELNCGENSMIQGRNLNGDERNYLVIGSEPKAIEVSYYKRSR